jgi:hypothetical protein
MLYNKNNFAVSKVASKEESRPYNINCVRFEKGKTIATDGHRLVIMTTPEDMSVDDFPVIPNSKGQMITDLNGGVSLPVESIKEFKFNKPNKGMPILNCTVLTRNGNDKFITINHTDLETTRQSECRVIESNFVDYNQVLPKTAPIAVIGLNAGYLKDICEIAQGLQGKDAAIKLSVYDKFHPQLIECDGAGQIMTAVIMPLQLGADPKGFRKHADIWDWTE